MQPPVSVILPVYNDEGFLPQVLDSLLAQTLEGIEILVVNDGSTDNSSDIALAKNCRVISQANQGLGAGRRRLVEEADGDLIAFLDHDDFWVPDKLEKQVSALDASGALMAHADCMFVYSDTGKIKSRWASISDKADSFENLVLCQVRRNRRNESLSYELMNGELL